MRPLIAVPGRTLRAGRVSHWREDALGAPAPYLLALRRAGATEGVLYPDPIDDDTADAMLERFDGLLLLGGGDVEPARYGQEQHPDVGGVNPVRDAFELTLIRSAMKRALPILAVCRGMQILNVALGGTLVQHLEGSSDILHRGHDDPWSTHDVRLEEDSLVADAMGGSAADCLASHHQAVDRLGDGLRAVAWTQDGVVEAVQRDDRWVLGVQWHPERTAETDRQQQGLFDALAEQARLRPAERPA